MQLSFIIGRVEARNRCHFFVFIINLSLLKLPETADAPAELLQIKLGPVRE